MPPRAHGVNPRDARTRRHPADLQLLSTHPRTQTHRAPPPHLATEAEASTQLRPPEGSRPSDRRGWNGEWKTALVVPCRRARVRSSASGEAVARLGDEARETQAGARAGRAGGRGAAPRFRGTDGFLFCSFLFYTCVFVLSHPDSRVTSYCIAPPPPSRDLAFLVRVHVASFICCCNAHCSLSLSVLPCASPSPPLSLSLRIR